MRPRTRTTRGEIATEISRGQIIFSFAIAIGFALLLFKVGPALLTNWLPIDGTFWFVIVEGCIRVAVFILYIGLIGLLPDLKRVFQYHGAEHKAINTLEAGARAYAGVRALAGNRELGQELELTYFIIRVVSHGPHSPFYRGLNASSSWCSFGVGGNPT